jgi:glycosyltransferase involved in cell wall biosynthesis
MMLVAWTIESVGRTNLRPVERTLREATRRLVAVSQSGAPGGAEAMLLRVLRAAVADGWTVECLSPPGPMVDRLRGAGIVVHVLPPAEGGEGPSAVRLLRFTSRALRIAAGLRRARRADVVLSNGLAALTAVRLARWLRLTGTARVVYYAHDVARTPLRQRYLRAGDAAVDVAFAVSEAVAEPLRERGLRCALLRNGVAWPVAAGIPAPGPPWLIGCAAALTSWKGQDVLLEAIARLGRADIVLQLVGQPFAGDRQYADGLHDRAARPDLAGQVEFLGWRDDVPTLMRGWHLAVSPSVEPEANGLSILEAMSLGVPLVCTDHGGPREVLGEAGLLVAPGDPDALAAGITRLLDDRELWARCAAAGPRAVATGMTAEIQEQRFLELLDEVLRSSAH